MILAPLINPPVAAVAEPTEPRPRAGSDEAASFRRALDAAVAGGAGPEAVREAATQFVASAFIVPALDALHESPFNDGPFAPGPGEKRFAPLLDQHLADRITHAARFPLVDVIVERLTSPRPGGGSTP
jgi:hypothetical protein